MASSGKKSRGNSPFPPNPSQWPAERNGMAFRSRFGRNSETPLRPFEVNLPSVTLLATLDDLREFVDEEVLTELFGVHRRKWSGMTIPIDDEYIVIMNQTHAMTRQSATLMEEYFHILLKHKPSRVGLCPVTGLIKREFDRKLETEAYHSAAAALVPFAALREHVEKGRSGRDIAAYFEVSEELVAFRLKTCKLYRRAS